MVRLEFRNLGQWNTPSLFLLPDPLGLTMGVPVRISWICLLIISIKNMWNHTIVYKLFVLKIVTWNYIIFICYLKSYNCEQTNDYQIGGVIWNYIIMYKLFALYRNTWNPTTLCKLFVLDKNTWYITVCKTLLSNNTKNMYLQWMHFYNLSA